MKQALDERRERQWRAIQAQAQALHDRGVLPFAPGELFGLQGLGADVRRLGQAAAIARCESIRREFEQRQQGATR